MSIDLYLGDLTLEQLRYAHERAAALIAARQAEPSVTVWTLSDSALVLQYFAEADYLKAAEALLERARKLDAEGAREVLRLGRQRMSATEAAESIADGPW